MKHNALCVVSVTAQNIRTGQQETWLAIDGIDPMPKEWEGNLSPIEKFIQGKVKTDQNLFNPRLPHALETIADNLNEDWILLEGGSSGPFCKSICGNILRSLGLELGGERYPALEGEEAYRIFWKP